jgi:hypothetical protein
MSQTAGQGGWGGISASASPEAALALLLVGTAGRRAAAAADIRALAARADLAKLTRRLMLQGHLGLAGSRLDAIEGGRLPRSFREAVDRSVEVTRRRGAVQATIAMRWTEKLEAAGIACLPIKGPLLGQRLFGDLGLRASGDVDLLVAPGDLWETAAIVRADGFAAPRDRLSADGLPERHLHLDDPSGRLDAVEVHWRIHWYERAFSADVLARSARDDAGLRVAQPADELAALLLFLARESFLGLRPLSDIAAWWDAFGDRLPPLALQPAVESYPELRFALATAAEVAGRLVGLPAERLLDLEPARAPRSRAAARLVNWDLSGSLRDKETIFQLVDWLLTPRGQRAVTLRRHLFRDPNPRSTRAAVAAELIRSKLRPVNRAARGAVTLRRFRGSRTFSPPVKAIEEGTAAAGPAYTSTSRT